MPRWVTRLHAWVYRRSGGRFLGRMGGQPVLLLQTTGRRSGQTHTTPVQYLADGDLRANPHAHIEVVGRTVDVRAQEATGPERAELWQRLTAANRYLERAARKARRELPLMTLVAATPRTPRQVADHS
jgi:F420H(2)-dependent quinone reductase